MKKLLSFCLCFLFVLNIFSVTVVASDSILYKTTVMVKSSTDGFRNRTVYFYDDVCYMNICDIVQLTRSEYDINDNTLTITHGSRNISVDLNKKTLTEGTIKYSINCLTNDNGIVLLHAYPVLTYLGATLGIDNGSLVVNMPLVTLWEAVERTGQENYVDISCFGDTEDQNLRLFWDTVLFALSGNLGKSFGNSLQVQAMCTSLGVDPLCYNAGYDEKLKLDAKCVEIFNNLEESNNMPEDFLSTSDKSGMNACNVVLDYIDGAAEAKSVLQQDAKLSSWAFVGYESVIQFYSNYSQNRKNSVESTKILTTLAEWATDDCDVKDAVSDASYKLNKDNAAITAVNETFRDQIASVILKFAIDACDNTGYIDLASKSLDISVWLNKRIYGENNQIDYVEKEIEAMYLLLLKKDITLALTNLGETIIKENYSDEKHLDDYRLLNMFYYKTLIASNTAYKNLIKNPKDAVSAEVISNIDRNTELFSARLFLLQNATVKAFPNLKSISKSNLWDEKNNLGLKVEKVEGGIDSVRSVEVVLIKDGIYVDDIKYFDSEKSSIDYDCAIICKNGKYGVIDINGNILHEPTFSEMYYSESMPSDREYRIYFYDELIGGEFVVSKEGRVTLNQQGGWGYDMDPIPYIYNDELIFFDMCFGIVEDTDSIKNTLIGEVVWEELLPVQKMNRYTITKNGYSSAATPELETEKYAFYDRSNAKLITDFIFDDYDNCIGFNEGILAVESNGKWGFMNQSGKMITDFRYSPEKTLDYGYMYDKDTEIINTCVNGYIAVREGELWGLIDSSGETIIEPKYEDVSQVHYSGAFFAKSDGEWSLYKLS
ncbi:MAG: WG repeat-containing protein [Ruminococcaceae bacterium]|nr:WG repeat-containing protein [Oscillospiraceae bacterium]